MFKKLFLCLTLFTLLVSESRAETLTWSASDSPREINGTYTIPKGTTVVVEAGAHVQINAYSTLEVEGELRAEGSPDNPVRFTAPDNYSANLRVRGSLTLRHAQVQVSTGLNNNSSLIASDTTFSRFGTVRTAEGLLPPGQALPYLQFDRCAFRGDGTFLSANLYVSYCTLAIRDTEFRDGSILNASYCYLLLDRVTSDRSAQDGLSLGSDSDLYVNNVTVTNAAKEGLHLGGDTRNGGNVHIGPQVRLEGNEYPVGLGVAGLWPESVIPSAGKRNNLIRITGATAALWPKFDLPYLVDASPPVISGNTQALPVPFSSIIIIIPKSGTRTVSLP